MTVEKLYRLVDSSQNGGGFCCLVSGFVVVVLSRKRKRAVQQLAGQGPEMLVTASQQRLPLPRQRSPNPAWSGEGRPAGRRGVAQNNKRRYHWWAVEGR